MAENTKIEWADHTFSPWTGCTKVGPGCDNCYAEGWSKRAGPKVGKWGPGAPRVRTTPANWRLPLKWEREAAVVQAGWAEGVKLYGSEEAALAAGHLKPSRPRVFCSSLADVFDNEVPAEWRADLFELISKTTHLDWLLLSKRIGNARFMIQQALIALGDPATDMLSSWPWPNVWLGATVVNQAEADRDIPKLLAVPARVRFLSIEPMLGPIDLSTASGAKALPMYWEGAAADGPLPTYCGTSGRRLNDAQRRGWVKTSENMSPWIDWVIGGFESGPRARPGNPAWARLLRDQCAAAGTAFLWKQNGEWARGGDLPDHISGSTYCDFDGELKTDDERVWKVGKKAAGRLLDGKTHDGFPEVSHG